jgi:hypothetical protein
MIHAARNARICRRCFSLKIVDESEWDLSGMRDRARAQRLLRPISPEAIIAQAASAALDPQVTSAASWRWQQGIDMAGCSRAIVVIPLTRDTYDDLFNGRCGYRAQYYRSVEEGKHFNRLLVEALCDAANRIFERNPKEPRWPILERSLMGEHSKVWPYGERSEAFVEAPKGEFAPEHTSSAYSSKYGFASCRHSASELHFVPCTSQIRIYPS